MGYILVTGGAGFIGSHTCLLLLEKGYEIIIVDSYLNSSKKSLERVKKIREIKSKNFNDKMHIYNGDLRNKDLIKKIFKDAKESKKKLIA